MAKRQGYFFENNRGHVGFLYEVFCQSGVEMGTVEWENHAGLHTYPLADLEHEGLNSTNKHFQFKTNFKPRLPDIDVDTQHAVALAAFLARQNPQDPPLQIKPHLEHVQDLMAQSPSHECQFKKYVGEWEIYDYCIHCDKKRSRS